MERGVFHAFARFAKAKGMRVRPGSVQSRPPPEPDIRCEVEGEGPVAFELVEIVDSTLRENISVAIRRNVPAEGGWVGDPTPETIRGKLGKTYKTPHPVELVAWANMLTTPPSVWLPTYEYRLRDLDLGPFRRLWVVNVGGRRNERGVWLVHPPLRTS